MTTLSHPCLPPLLPNRYVRERDRHRERERDKETERQTQTQRDTERHRETDRERETERTERERERERTERETCIVFFCMLTYKLTLVLFRAKVTTKYSESSSECALPSTPMLALHQVSSLPAPIRNGSGSLHHRFTGSTQFVSMPARQVRHSESAHRLACCPARLLLSAAYCFLHVC